ncbi:MAG: cadherin-like domain-containing protein [Chloroflexi bacterium]|nr:cadherin-like domain-containing protein [Chloroflexota bacterium]
MLRSSKFISIVTLLLIMMGGVSNPTDPVAAVESQTPTSPGTWSQDFGLYFKTADNSYTPLRPIEWNGTLYAILHGHDNFESGVGYWNGQQWLKIDGLGGFVDSLTVHQNRLYVAGRITIAGKNLNLASWDGNLWTAMPTQFTLNSPLNLISYANQLYVGGYQLIIDGQAYGSLARWDGEQWHAAAAGIDGIVFSLLVRPDGLYLGGSFVFNNQKTGVLYWNGTQWQTVGGGVYGHVFDLKWANSQLYISGQFTSTLVPTMKNVAAWNGTSWHTFGTGLAGSIHNLTIMDGELYVLNRPTGVGYEYLHWDGDEWTLLTNLASMNYPYRNNWLLPPHAMFVQYQQELLLIGEIGYSSDSSQPVHHGDSTLRWNGTHWDSMSPNGIFAPQSAAIATDDENLLVAARTFYWGNGTASLAQFGSNQQWQTIVERQYTLEPPQALEAFQQSHFIVANNTLYQAASTTWNQIGVIHVVDAIAQSNNKLYVAGDFEQFNGVTAHNLVTWDGTQWQALNTPASFDQVVLIEAHGNDVYISDGFQLARWDGTQWTTLATNVVNIGSIEATANGVYIAGTFSSVGGVTAPKIAYWNGTVWAGLSGTISGSINDLEMGADGLYVAGNFFGLNNGIVSPGILRWDGAAWHGVGGGVQTLKYPSGVGNGTVQRLAATPTRMFMYGDFNWVGNQYESYNFAVWEYGNEPLIKAKPDYAITYRPQAVTVNVLANDWSYQPSQLQLVNLTAPSHGTAVISGNSVVYTPYPQFAGIDTLTYTVRDPINAVTTTAQLRLHVWNTPNVVLSELYLPAVTR